MHEKTYMRFNFKEDKEYLYGRDYLNKGKIHEDHIGKIFIDFLANSDDIIKVIEAEIDQYYKNDKLTNTKRVHTITKFKLEKLNTFFRYFDFDDYIENYIIDLRNENNIEIQNCLEEIKSLENNIEYYNSKEYYDDLLKEELSFYHDYDSEKSKEAFFYIERCEKTTNKTVQKFIKKYGYKPSYNTYKKVYDKNKDYIKGKGIINEIENDIYSMHKVEMEKKINNEIQKEIKRTKHHIKFYKNNIKYYIKNNDRTIKEILDEYVKKIKFWIAFSRYILISYYDLSSEKYDNNLSSTQRLLDYLLHIERTYYNQSISELPKSNITLELENDEGAINLSNFITKNKNALLHNEDDIYKKLNKYNVNLIQEYAIDSIADFICVSLIQILQHNIKLCRCENCDKLFISTNKSNEKYCTYEFKDKKACRDLSYSIHLQKDKLSNILRKKYRTENAKKNRNKHIPKIEEKFQIWYAKAKEQKLLCEKGEISVDDFNKWFTNNSKWF